MREDYFIVPGRLLFEDLYQGVVPPKGDPSKGLRYSVTVQTAKDAACLDGLFALVEKVGTAVWGAKAKEYLTNIQACIDQGWPPSKGLISIRDGDHANNQPERNRGFYLISASRYDKKDGPPAVCDPSGAPAVPGTPGAPKAGDGVLMLINVWAQPQYDRINFTLESVRKAIEGAPLGGGPSSGDRAAAREAFSQAQLPTSITGVKPAVAATASPQATGTPGGWGQRSSAPPAADVPVSEAPRGRRLTTKL